jgi:hypothetical protein
VQKARSSNITLRVNFTMTLDAKFILMFKFKFILACYFDILKERLDNMKKRRKIFEFFSSKCKLICIETLYK